MVSIESAFPFAPRQGTALARFVAKIDASGECWSWTDHENGNGYGRMRVEGKYHLSHRLAFLWANGYLTKGLTIDHLCRNRACVNPSHLEEVARSENVLRGEGLTAANARKTHCKRGHEFTEDNTYRVPGRLKGRQCRTCHAAYDKDYQPKYRAAKRLGESK